MPKHQFIKKNGDIVVSTIHSDLSIRWRWVSAL